MRTSTDPTGSILFVEKPYPSLHRPRQYNTRLLLHAEHATFHTTVTSSEDNGICIICLAFTNDVKVPLFQHCVSQQMAR